MNLGNVLQIRVVNAVTLTPGGGPEKSFSAKEGVTMELHPAGVTIATAKGVVLVPYANIASVQCEPVAQTKTGKAA